MRAKLFVMGLALATVGLVLPIKKEDSMSWRRVGAAAHLCRPGGTVSHLSSRSFAQTVQIIQPDFNELVPQYENCKLVARTCTRCGWRHERDVYLADIDALAIARAEFSITLAVPARFALGFIRLKAKVLILC